MKANKLYDLLNLMRQEKEGPKYDDLFNELIDMHREHLTEEFTMRFTSEIEDPDHAAAYIDRHASRYEEELEMFLGEEVSYAYNL